MRKIFNRGLFFLFALGLIVISKPCYSQYNLDFGANLGASNYLGDIGGTSKTGEGGPRNDFIEDIQVSQTRFAIGGWYRYRLHPLISIKANLMFIRIGGADSISDYVNRRGRNLHFRNDIYELSGQGEYHFISANQINNRGWLKESRGRIRLDFGSYAFIGGGVFFHNPKAKYLGKWHALQPLGTEGQGRIEKADKTGAVVPFEKYKRIQGNVLGGMGFFYTVERKYRIGMEFGVRMTFTDYLDDISDRYAPGEILNDGTADGELAEILSNRSQNAEVLTDGAMTEENYGKTRLRGDVNNNDWYFFTVITAGRVIRGRNTFYKSKYKSLTGSKRRKQRKQRAKF